MKGSESWLGNPGRSEDWVSYTSVSALWNLTATANAGDRASQDIGAPAKKEDVQCSLQPGGGATTLPSEPACSPFCLPLHSQQRKRMSSGCVRKRPVDPVVSSRVSMNAMQDHNKQLAPVFARRAQAETPSARPIPGAPLRRSHVPARNQWLPTALTRVPGWPL